MGMFIQTSGNIDTVAKDAALLLRPSNVSLFTPTASLSLDGDDVKVFATGKANVNGSTIVLGGAAAQPTINQTDFAALVAALGTFATAIGTVEGTNSPPPTGAAAFVSAIGAFTASLSSIMAGLATRKTRNE
jgi:hypothetical protein